MAKYVCKECDNTLNEKNGEDKSCNSCGVNNPCHRCDSCNAPLESGEGFWTDGEVETKNQKKVAKIMNERNQDVLCDYCFNEYKDLNK